MSNIAIIAAAGNGERLNCNHSKMLAKIMGRPLLAYTLDQFEQSPMIDQIVLVVKAEDQKDIEEEILKVNRYKKISSIVLGGSTRQDSVYRGLKSIQESHGVACIHDGARPLVKGWMIEKTLDLVNEYDGVIIAVPVIETIKQALLDDMIVNKTVNRDEFWIVQTPQTFNLGYIKDLYQRAKDEELVVTDDASIVEHYGGRIKIVPGTRDNLKITTSFDLALAEVLMRKYL
ncbi:MAG: 2-C-methyl-D-erythritol 4-phosphate cytidylyltransferase [Candidatus Atribacteria bacterium]|nr:2-C-methyl-D-erythritol 4-phosphate cytidylyltransferase [Candidatus Atribacteria bacterium]